MLVEVIKEFHDIADFSVIHKVGSVVDFEKNRAIGLIGLGIVKEHKEVEDTEEPIKTERRGRKKLTE